MSDLLFATEGRTLGQMEQIILRQAFQREPKTTKLLCSISIIFKTNNARLEDDEAGAQYS
jgi:hypothetical protein